VFGELCDALIIFGVIITVALTEATIEWRAGRAVAALSTMAEPKALVWRDGALIECATEAIVPGDLIELRAGSRVPADAEGIVLPESRTFPFDRAVRIASGYGSMGGTVEAGVKGAPEAVLARASAWREGDAVRPLDEPTRLAFILAAAGLGRGGRVLAIGSRTFDHAPAFRRDLAGDLVWEGVIVLRDPVRAEVPAAIGALKAAGARVVIITGDQASTAAAVARGIGLPEHRALTGVEIAALDDAELVRLTAGGAVVARAQPADKLRIVETLGAAGEVVTVTGDGVNDAPALRAASVGVAMGRVGSDAARQAAQVVLIDDSFATLVRAVCEGRRLYDNFRKAIRYYLAVKVALVLVMAAAAVLGLSLPFTPV
jgi:Ca2+-transporting ATPase